MRVGYVGLLLSLTLSLSSARAADLTLEVSGSRSVVFNPARDRCDANDIPDVNPRVYRDGQGGVTMFALHFINRALRGPDVDHLKIDCAVALGSSFDANPSRYADRSFIAATWSDDGRAVSALVHHEYHAEEHGRCRATGDLACWYNSILAYRSDDGGASFSRAHPLVVAAAPFTQDVDQGRHRGFFNPSNIVSDGTYKYTFASTTGWRGQAFGNCLLRTSNPSDPALWRAYDGRGFTIRYDDPYMGPTRPKPCATIAPFAYTVGSLTRHRGSGLWLAVFQAARGGSFPVDGFYYATARDLLHWGEPRLLLAGKTLYSDLCGASASAINYPALIDPHSPSRNFDVVEDHPELFFTVIGVADCHTGERLLVRQSVTITTTGETR